MEKYIKEEFTDIKFDNTEETENYFDVFSKESIKDIIDIWLKKTFEASDPDPVNPWNSRIKSEIKYHLTLDNQIIVDSDQIMYKYKSDFTSENLDIIRDEYSWEKLIDEHEKYFKWILEDTKKR